MSWRVLVDFDGTITLDDVTNAILDRFADTSWRDIEAEWEAGLIGSRECMARQISLIRAEPREIDDFVAATTVDPFFVPFVTDCRRRGIPLVVVSDGLDRVIASVLRRLGLGDLPFVANHFAYVGDKRWQLLFPYSRDDCRSLSGTCKCATAQAQSRGGGTTILIGDGRSDLCVAEVANYVLAKKSLPALCRHRGIAHKTFTTFEDAAHIVGALDRMWPATGIEETTYA